MLIIFYTIIFLFCSHIVLIISMCLMYTSTMLNTPILQSAVISASKIVSLLNETPITVENESTMPVSD